MVAASVTQQLELNCQTRLPAERPDLCIAFVVERMGRVNKLGYARATTTRLPVNVG